MILYYITMVSYKYTVFFFYVFVQLPQEEKMIIVIIHRVLAMNWIFSIILVDRHINPDCDELLF